MRTRTLERALLISCIDVLLLAGVSPANRAKAPRIDSQGERQDQGEKQKAGESKESDNPIPKTYTNLQIQVVGEESRRVEGADVTVTSQKKDTEFEWNGKTNPQGIVSLSKVPRVKVRILVVANDQDWKTFGDDFTLSKANEVIKITLQKHP